MRLEKEREARRIRENPRKYLEMIQRLTAENKSLKSSKSSLNQSIVKKEEALRRKEKEWRLKEEREIKKTQENSRKYEMRIQRLTEENKSLKSSKSSLTQKIKNYEKLVDHQVELKQKVGYYKDKYHSALKMIETAKKEVKKSDNLEEESAEKEEKNCLKCSLCGETRKLKGSVKEKFESMQGQYKIIRKFKINGAKKKKSREVYRMYICLSIWRAS